MKVYAFVPSLVSLLGNLDPANPWAAEKAARIFQRLKGCGVDAVVGGTFPNIAPVGLGAERIPAMIAAGGVRQRAAENLLPQIDLYRQACQGVPHIAATAGNHYLTDMIWAGDSDYPQLIVGGQDLEPKRTGDMAQDIIEWNRVNQAVMCACGQRTMDIWNPRIVDWLVESATVDAVDGFGLWLALGRAGAWVHGHGELDGGQEHYTPGSEHERRGLGHSDEIDLRRHGRAVNVSITRRLGEIARAAVERLKGRVANVWFSSNPVPPTNSRPGYQARGLCGGADELCRALADVTGIKVNVVFSQASILPLEGQDHARQLIKQYGDRIDFFAGVHWLRNFRFNGPKRKADGYAGCLVGIHPDELDAWLANNKDCRLEDGVAALRDA